MTLEIKITGDRGRERAKARALADELAERLVDLGVRSTVLSDQAGDTRYDQDGPLQGTATITVVLR